MTRAARLRNALAFHVLVNARYVLSSGQVLRQVHTPTLDCFRLGCAMHHPTDPNPEWPQVWRAGDMYRQCPHGNFYVDHDHRRFVRRRTGRYDPFWYEGAVQRPTCGCRKL